MYAVCEPLATAVVSASSGDVGSNPTIVSMPSPLKVSGTATSAQSTSGLDSARPSREVTRGSHSSTDDARTSCRLWESAARWLIEDEGVSKSSVGGPSSSTSRTVNPTWRALTNDPSYRREATMVGLLGSLRSYVNTTVCAGGGTKGTPAAAS